MLYHEDAHTNSHNRAQHSTAPRPRVASMAVDISTQVLPVLFITVVLGLNLVQPQHNPLKDTVSQLVLGHDGWLAALLFFISGLVLIIFSIRIASVITKRFFAIICALLVALMGVGFLLVAVFPTQLPGSVPTATYWVHQCAACFIATIFPVTVFLFWYGLRQESRHKTLCQAMAVMVIAAVIMDVWGLVAVLLDTSWKGAIERLIILNGLVWLQAIGWHLLAIKRAR